MVSARACSSALCTRGASWLDRSAASPRNSALSSPDVKMPVVERVVVGGAMFIVMVVLLEALPLSAGGARPCLREAYARQARAPSSPAHALPHG